MLCSIKPILSWKADQDSLICTLTVRLSNLCRDISHELSSREGSGVVGWRQNDQAIIEELENNPVMIDQFLIGWGWLLTGTEPFLHNKNVFYLDSPVQLCPTFSPQSKVSPEPDKTFLPCHDFRCFRESPSRQDQVQIVYLYSISPSSISSP